MNSIRLFAVALAGIALGGVCTRGYDYFNQLEKNRSIHEFSIESNYDIDWRAGVGDDVVVNFQSFIEKNEKKVLDGPSLQWYPATGEKSIKVYHDGLLDSVEVGSRED